MSASPFRPQPPKPQPQFSAAEQSELDRLYWDESMPVTEIAEQFELFGNAVHRVVTPRETDDHCLICGDVAELTSRSSRGTYWLPCRTCGHSVRQGGPRRARHRRPSQHLASVDLAENRQPVTHLLVRRRAGEGGRDIGIDAFEAADGLAAVGRPFDDGRTVGVLEPADGIGEIQNLLASFPVSTLGVATLRTLGNTQTEAVQNLWYLTSDGWTVVSGADSSSWTSNDAWDEPEGFAEAASPFGADAFEMSFDDGLAERRIAGQVIDATRRFGGR